MFIALSALQGRPLVAAFDELSRLGVDGIQLTPGNAPEPDARDRVAKSGTRTMLHHGFSWWALRQPVWSTDGRCLVRNRSVHPPRANEVAWDDFARTCECSAEAGLVFEVMYPGYHLGNGAEVEWAMDQKLSLALDVSHVHIQLEQGAMEQATWNRLQGYEQIAELHVSANDGRRDQHRPLDAGSFGLAFARERAADGAPLVLESYVHRLDDGERLRQVALCGH